MDYVAYFDSLMEKNLYEEKDKLLSILEEQHTEASVQNYDGLEELLFEFLLALEGHEDFNAVIRLHELTKTHYPKAYKKEFGQFADILISYYISTQEDAKAKSFFEQWLELDYSYDTMLIILNRLAHYGKEAWIAHYLEKEYEKIKKGSGLLEGAEEDLNPYMVMLEVGKVNKGLKSIEEALQALEQHGIEMRPALRHILEKGEEYSFTMHREEAVATLANNFQQYLNKQFAIPYLQSGVIIDTLIDYFENSRYTDRVSYFKINEGSFNAYMQENTVHGWSFNIESNFAMLYTLPVLHQFLAQRNIFTDEDVKAEGSKVAKLLEQQKEQYPSGARVLDTLDSYQRLKAVSNA